MNLVARGDQTRHQLFSNRAGRTCHKHSHHWLLDRKIIYSNDKTAASGVTPNPDALRIGTPSAAAAPER
jgi:hypothetical protein